MNLKYTVIPLLFLPFWGICQSSIDLIGGIEYSYRQINTSSDDDIVLEIIEKRDRGERGKLNWRAGFNYNRQLTRKLFLKTGLRLASVGYVGKKSTGLKWESEYINGGWQPDPSLPHVSQNFYNYWLAEIPIAVRLELNDKKWSPFFELGLSPSLYLVTRIKSVTDIDTGYDFRAERTSGVNDFHMAGFASFGMNYSINKKFQVFLQPIFRYHLTSLSNHPIKTYLFNYGIEIGLRRRIK